MGAGKANFPCVFSFFVISTIFVIRGFSSINNFLLPTFCSNQMMILRCLSVFILFLAFFPSTPVTLAQKSASSNTDRWIDSVMKSLTLEEKIGQLFMVATFSNKDEAHYKSIDNLIRDQHLGGLIFMQGDPVSQARLVNRYQRAAHTPLLIAQDAEWGPAMRLKGVQAYPKNMTLGAIREDSLLYFMGAQMARELKAVGVNVNFAPVVDVNNNPQNPVINYRSFGENKYNVARKGAMLSLGMQSEQVIACAKHFPGHGDTDTDSHYDLPLIPHNLTRLDTLELYPFTRLIGTGVQSLMVAHLYVPSLDPTPNLATSLSPRVVGGLLRDSLGYDGLVFTDALNMHGVARFYSSGEIALRAFEAGNDVLLFPSDIPKSARIIKEAIAAGTISEQELNQRVRRILKAKYSVGLQSMQSLEINKVKEQLNTRAFSLLRKKLYEAAVTIPVNENNLLPLRHLEKRKIAYVQVGGGSENAFDETLKKYTRVDRFYLRKNFTSGEKDKLIGQLAGYNTIILGVMGMNNSGADNYGISESTGQLGKELSARFPDVILSVFGNPYSLRNFGAEDAVVLGYEATEDACKAVAMAIFGGISVSGRLPVTASPQFREGMGVVIEAPIRFGFAMPEEEGMDAGVLNRIDSIAGYWIRRQAAPGCAVLVMRGNNIVYVNGFGNTEYTRNGTPIDPWESTYDLASVTKVAATTLCTMHLVEQGKISLDKPIVTYLPDLKGTNKASLTIRRLMQHNAGLPSWIPFYLDTYKDEKRQVLDPGLYSYQPSRSGNSTVIAPSLYGTPELDQKVWEMIREVEIRKTNRVRYSDIGMILLGKIIESVTNQSLDEYAAELLYQPLGMNQTLFTPWKYGRESACPPTEADATWRNAVIRGYVHDPASAIMGGVAGHAGLFSNVYDLAKLALMVKSGGFYGGENFYRASTIDYFTRKQLSYNRKGLGWDKPEIPLQKSTPTSEYASPRTFGHTGFTGTCLWVDPEHDLVYIFLSNRTFPTASNRLLLRENVRTLIMDQIYESIRAYRPDGVHSPNP